MGDVECVRSPSPVTTRSSSQPYRLHQLRIHLASPTLAITKLCHSQPFFYLKSSSPIQHSLHHHLPLLSSPKPSSLTNTYIITNPHHPPSLKSSPILPKITRPPNSFTFHTLTKALSVNVGFNTAPLEKHELVKKLQSCALINTIAQ